MKKWMLILSFGLGISIAWAQQNVQVIEKKGIILKNEFSLGARLYTQGWAVNTDIGKQLTVSKKKIYQIEFIELRHPKQNKQSNDGMPISVNSPKPFFYGKQHTFFAIHLGYGYKKIIGEKAEKSGVEVSYSYTIGPSIGLLKPYYLYIIYNNQGAEGPGVKAIRYEDDPAQFLSLNSIYGSAGLFYGVGKTKILPGIHGKLGFHFDWARDDDVIKEIEAGVALDVYVKKAPIMVIENNQQFFPLLYVGVHFGKRR